MRIEIETWKLAHRCCCCCYCCTQHISRNSLTVVLHRLKSTRHSADTLRCCSFIFTVFFFLFSLLSICSSHFILATFNHFGQLIITAMGMSKIFKSIHPTDFFFLFAPQSGHVFCIVFFFSLFVFLDLDVSPSFFRISILCVLLLCLTSKQNHPKKIYMIESECNSETTITCIDKYL